MINWKQIDNKKQLAGFWNKSCGLQPEALDPLTLCKKGTDFARNNYHWLLIIVFLVFLKKGYLVLQEYNAEGLALSTVVDQMIPMTSIFVLFYVLYYPFIVISLIVAGVKEKEVFYKTLGTMILISLGSFLIYYFFQTEMKRTELVMKTIFDQLVSLVYTLDKPLNLFPSLHVSLTAAAFFITYKVKKEWSYFTLPIALGIICSTIFIKQHYFVDILGGIVLGISSYVVLFEMSKIKITLIKIITFLTGKTAINKNS